jgi:hypothetical protein
MIKMLNSTRKANKETTLCSLIKEDFKGLYEKATRLNGNLKEMDPAALEKRIQSDKRAIDRNLSCEAGLLSLPTDKYITMLGDLEHIAREPAEDIRKGKFQSWAALEADHRKIYEKHSARMLAVVRVTDLMGMTYGAIAAYTQKDRSPFTTLALTASAIFYMIDAFKNKEGDFFGKNRLRGATLSALPATELFIKYFLTGNHEYAVKAVNAGSMPSMMMTNTILIPGLMIYQDNFLRTYKKAKRMVSSFGLPRDIKNQVRRLEHTFGEIKQVQKIQGISSTDHPQEIKDFEDACISYLSNSATGKNVVRDARRALELAFRKREPASQSRGEELESLVTHEAPVIATNGSTIYQGTYDLALEFGADEMLAKRIARTVQPEAAHKIVSRLQSIVGAGHRQVLEANPGMLLMNRERKDNYFASLSSTLKRIAELYNGNGQSHDEASPEVNPAVFSTPEGLEYLNQSLDQRLGDTQKKEEASDDQVREAKLRQEGYANFNLLKAVLLGGFRLSTGRPRIAMGYSKFQDIRNETRPGLSQREMEDFNDVFGRLIRDGVILTDKDTKRKGGRFPGAYSINPHVTGIAKPALKEYITHYLYQRQREIVH